MSLDNKMCQILGIFPENVLYMVSSSESPLAQEDINQPIFYIHLWSADDNVLTSS